MSVTDALAPSTYSTSDRQLLESVHKMLVTGENRNSNPRYYLADGDDYVELPEEIYVVLRRVVDAMQKGLSVTISPTSQTLTTQQAADLLGISRPTLIKTLDSGKIPYTRAGTHRRIALTDVLNYREERRQEQYAAIESLSVGINESVNISEVISEIRQARKAVAKQRRKG